MGGSGDKIFRNYFAMVFKDFLKYKEMSPVLVFTSMGTLFSIYFMWWSYHDTLKHEPVSGPPHRLFNYLSEEEKTLKNYPTQETLVKEMDESTGEKKRSFRGFFFY